MTTAKCNNKKTKVSKITKDLIYNINGKYENSTPTNKMNDAAAFEI